MKRLILVSIMVLASCSQPDVWKHNNMAEMNLTNDLATCRYEAQKALASYSGDTDPGRDGHRISVITLFNIYGKQIRENSIIHSCMELKGYYRGGGGGTAATSTPTGTTVNLATFKGFYAGTAATGSQMSFTLTGSDTSGNAWNGSFAVTSDGTTTFESQNVTKSRVIITLTRTATGVSATSIDTRYFLASNGNFYKSVNSSGVTSVPSTQTPIADKVHVGDFGNLWNLTKSDGTSESTTWKLETNFNGNSKLAFSSVLKNSSNVVTGLENVTFYLDSTGNPYKYAVTVTSRGTTITMSGNRNY